MNSFILSAVTLCRPETRLNRVGSMFSVRPVFIGWIALLYQLPFQLFLSLWSGAFFGGLISSLHVFPKDSLHPFVFFGGIVFIGFPLVAYFGKKLNYARTEYKFSEDRLEFDEGFINVTEKVVKFRDVKEVTLRKSIFQRTCDLGTIYLATDATGSSGHTNIFNALGFGNISASGVGVCDIANPDETFERVRRLVDTQRI
jgi:membrane protein YdbS with pleckstrin-like domain